MWKDDFCMKNTNDIIIIIIIISSSSSGSSSGILIPLFSGAVQGTEII
jgi:hypothetical protein